MDAEVYRRMAETEDRHWWFAGRRHLVDLLLRRWGPAGPARDRQAVDAGCGSGGNLALLQAHGFTVLAFEPDASARQVAEERARRLNAPAGQLRVMPGALPDAVALPAGSADVVVCLDVLEHVEDDAGALRRLWEATRPGGRLVLTVPAHPRLFGPHDRTHCHWRRYTAAGLRAHLEAAGWTVRHLGWFNGILGLLAVPVRLWARTLDRAGDAGGRVGHANGLWRCVLRTESVAAARGWLPWGLSLVAVAERPQARPSAPAERQGPR